MLKAKQEEMHVSEWQDTMVEILLPFFFFGAVMLAGRERRSRLHDNKAVRRGK